MNRTAYRPGHTAPANDGSRTVTIHESQTPEAGPSSQPDGVLRLRGDAGANTSSRRVVWTEDTIDNEGMGKKKSKICCIYHKPRAFDESSSDSDGDSDSDSDSSSASSTPPSDASDAEDGPSMSQAMKDKMARRRRGAGGEEHSHDHDHDHEHGDGGTCSGHGKKQGSKRRKAKTQRSGRTMVITETQEETGAPRNSGKGEDDDGDDGYDGSDDGEGGRPRIRNAYERQ